MKTLRAIGGAVFALSLGFAGSAHARSGGHGGGHGGGHSGGGHSDGGHHGSGHSIFAHHHSGFFSPGIRGLSRYGSYYGGWTSYGSRGAPIYRGPVADYCPECALNAEVQMALARRGYYRGPIDSIIGSGSRGALRAFQRAARLPGTGRIDRATLDGLDID